jgi:hypothetical protein
MINLLEFRCGPRRHAHMVCLFWTVAWQKPDVLMHSASFLFVDMFHLLYMPESLTFRDRGEGLNLWKMLRCAPEVLRSQPCERRFLWSWGSRPGEVLAATEAGAGRRCREGGTGVGAAGDVNNV